MGSGAKFKVFMFLKKLLIPFCLLMSLAFAASAQEGFDNGFGFRVNEDGETVTLTSYDPEQLENPWYGEPNWPDVTIPSTVAIWGDDGFLGYFGVSAIGNYAFYDGQLKSVTLPGTISSIGESAFENCSELNHIYFEENLLDLSSIGYRAFANSGLEELNFPEYYMLENPIAIGDQAFRECGNLTSVSISSVVKSLGKYAFYKCQNLTSATISDNSIDALNDGVFASCGNLSQVSIGNSVKSIGASAFDCCESLSSINVPNSVESIRKGAFWRCSNLSSVSIGTSLSTLGEDVFSFCDALSTITVAGGNSTFDSRNNCNAIIHTSTNTLVAGCKTTVIPGTVQRIGDKAFIYCTMTNMRIPESVNHIGNNAFFGCQNLENFNIPNAVTQINEGVFGNTFALKQITIPESVTLIGKDAFLTGGLTSITIPNSVTTIEENAFYNNTRLTSATIGINVTHIGKEAFEACWKLNEVYSYANPDNLTVEEDVFAGIDSTAILYVPREHLDDYKALWGNYFSDVRPIGGDVLPDGDVNGDGLVDVEDVNATINIILKLNNPDENLGSADLDGNGIVDVEDVNRLINIILGGN